MNHLYFLRHGLSEANKNAFVWSGDTDVPLAPEGIEEAILAGKKAKEAGLKVDLIISSPLSRAHDTAKIFAKEVGYPIDKIVLDNNLIERSFGVFENKKDLMAHVKYALNEASIDNYENVEKLGTLQERAQHFLEYVTNLEPETILVVGHGGFGRAFRRAVDDEPLHHRGETIQNADLLKFI